MYFIQIEDRSLGYYLWHKIWEITDTGIPDPEYVYPSKLWKEYGKRITKPTIKDWCEKFEGFGIFSSEEKRTDGVNSFQKTKHYCLRRDTAALKLLIDIIVENFTPFDRLVILSSGYFDYLINEDLIRDILFKKGAYIRNGYDLLDVNWKNIRSAWNLWVSSEDFDEDRLVKEIQDAISQDDVSEPGRSSHFKRCLIFPCAFNCAIPIVTDTYYKTKYPDFIGKIKFNWTMENADEAMRGYPEIFQFHRDFIETRKVIYPILALIKTSPLALQYFLLGKWQSFDLEMKVAEDQEYASEFMKDMVSIAARDISHTLQIPMNNFVNSVDFNPRRWHLSPKGESRPEIAYLSFSLRNGTTLWVDLKYSARPISTQLCWTPVDDEGTYSPGFQHVVKVPTEKDFTLRIRTSNSPASIAFEDIKDKRRFMEWLSSDEAVPRHLVQLLSNRVQNLIRFYPQKDNPSDTFIEVILEDFNRALEKPNFFEKSVFEGAGVDVDTYHQTFERLNKDPVKHGLTQVNVTFDNRQLIDSIIPDILYKFGELQPSPEAVREHINKRFD